MTEISIKYGIRNNMLCISDGIQVVAMIKQLCRMRHTKIMCVVAFRPAEGEIPLMLLLHNE